MPTWYGWSADITLRGLKNLRDLKLIEQREGFKKAALTAPGSTMFYDPGRPAAVAAGHPRPPVRQASFDNYVRALSVLFAPRASIGNGLSRYRFWRGHGCRGIG